MSKVSILPHGGINRRFPEHKIIGEKLQKVKELRNLFSLNGRIYLPPGGERYDSSDKGGNVKWAKRIYYKEGADDKRYQFCVIDGIMYRGDDATETLNQVTINNDLNLRIDSGFYPIDAVMKVSENVSTMLVDGKYFYKFTGNDAGNWEQLPLKEDTDGNTIQPIFIEEYLDRMFVLVKGMNVILYSVNKNPEVYDDSTDAGIIDIPPGNGGFPQSLIVHRGQLYVVHEDYFAPVSGSSAATFGVKPGDIIHGYGTRAPRSVLSMKTQFAFLNSRDNEWYTTGGTLDSTQKTPLSYEIKFGEMLNPVKVSDTVAHLDTNLNCIRISYVRTGETVLNTEVLYSIDEEKWCGETRERNISCYSPWNGRGDNGELITGRSDKGILMKHNSALNWDDSPIHYKLVTGSYELGTNEHNNYEVEKIYPDIKALGNFGIPFGYYMDTRLTNRGLESVNAQGEVITLGLIEIGEQLSFMQVFKPLINMRKGRLIRFEIEETVSNRVFEMYGIYLEVNKGSPIFSKYIMGAQ